MSTGPEAPEPGARPYRLSDQERDEAIAALGDAYAEGRLDAAEFAQRLEQASTAVLATDLDPLFADLPQRGPRGPAAPRAQVARLHSARGERGSWPSPHPGRHGGHPMMLAPALLIVLAVATQIWLLIPVAFLVAGGRRRAWAAAHHLPRAEGGLGSRSHGCGRP